MALFTELDIFVPAYELSTLCAIYTGSMPKNHRSMLGLTLLENCQWSIKCLRLANSARGAERLRHIEDLREAISMIEFSLRQCVDRRLKLITRAQYAAAIKAAGEFGKKATGWKKQTENALVAPSSRR
ncbi:hypothetical protein [Achromobacter aloeverae]